MTELDALWVSDIARAFGLGDVRSYRRVLAGTINSNYCVDTADSVWFVRVNEGKSEADVAYEADLVERLVAAGVKSPLPQLAQTRRRYAEVRGRWISVFPWISGHHPSPVTPAVVGELGRELARLHRAGEAATDVGVREGNYTLRHIERRAASFAQHEDLHVASAAIDAELEWQRLHRDRAAGATGIIHQDLFIDNVLFDGGRVVALLDFEQACFGSFTYDLAVCLNAWCYDDGFDRSRIVALRAGYESEAGRVDDHALFIECRRAAVRFAVTRVTDVYLRGRRGPGKSYQRYLDRLAAWQLLGAVP